MTSAPLVAVKLGGSLLTDKAGREAVRADVLERLAAELREALSAPAAPRVLLAHGSGSFGHRAAVGTPLGERGRAKVADPEALARAAARTQDAAARLHRMVVAALLRADVPAFSLAPSSFLWGAASGRTACGSLEPLFGALALGLVPVTYGDVIVDHGAGARICSTEEVLVDLVERLADDGGAVREVLWLGETDGVLDPTGSTIATIDETNLETARAAAGGSGGVDVTGGMRLRLDAAWRLACRGVPSVVLDGRSPGSLRNALFGNASGTRVRAERLVG